MTAPIAAIGALSALSGAAPASAAAPTALNTAAGPTTAAGQGSSAAAFAEALGHGFDAVQGAQSTADGLAVQAASGTLTDPAQYTIAATQAALMTQLATTLENKAVTAFNTVMGMQA